MMWGYGPNYGMMSGYGGYSYGYGLVHMIVWITVLVAIVVAVGWLVRSIAGQRGQQVSGKRSAGLEVLEERYARGEIQREEYLQKKKDIAG